MTSSHWWSRIRGPHSPREYDLLEADLNGPLLPERAQTSSQDAIFEPRRCVSQGTTLVQSRPTTMYSLDSSLSFLSPPATLPTGDSSIQNPIEIRPALSPRASSLFLENMDKSKDYFTVEVHPDETSDSSRNAGKGHTRRWWHKLSVAIKSFVLVHVDPKTIWNMLDCREIFWPFSWRKYITLSVVALLIASIVISEWYFRWVEKSMAITRKNILAILVIVIGLEPAMITLMLLVARIPDARSPMDIEARSDHHIEKNREPRDQRTALVIPCHNSDHDALTKVLESAYPHFHPSSIFIVDNGRSMHPKNGDFRNFIYSLNPDINYIWSPIGSKNAAQLVGAMTAKNFEFIMTVDDDVSIPASFCAPVDKINNVVKGVAFPLKAIDVNGNTPLFWVAWQDVEYRMAGLVKLAESSICGVLYPHGAGWFCERETLIDLISNYHSLDFIAEDVNTGISMQRMKKRIAFDASCVLETEVPTTFIGPGLNWYNQRVRSWEMGRHGRLLAFLGRLFFSFNGQTTLHGILWQKFVHFYSIACIIVDWVRVPVLVTMGANGQYWRQAGSLMMVSVLPVLWYNCISCRRRPDYRTTLWGALTIPIYKQIYALVSLAGAIRSVVFYIGVHKKPKTVSEMVRDGDRRAFWLDPRFDSNPAYLADEQEN